MAWEPTAAGLPPEFLRSCLLLLLAEEPSHGYHLWDQVAGLGVDMDSGTVYRHLRAMEDEGLVRSQWQLSDSGPPRRTYELTAGGTRCLRASEQAVRSLLGLLEAFAARSRVALGSCVGAAPPGPSGA